MKPDFSPLDAEAVDFLSEETGIEYRHIDFDKPHWFCITQRRDDGSLMGVLACEFKTWFEAHFTCAIADQRFMSKRLLRTIFTALFSRAVRVTALVAPDNHRAIAQMRRLGFVYEGFIRKGVEGHRDALMFGMLREDCRFLPGVRPQPAPAPFPLGEASYGLHS
jgi:hypothetical protein